jgi:lipoate---protein ligase
MAPVVETGESHPESRFITGEWILEADGPPFHFWQPQEWALVLGASQDPEREFHLDAVERMQVRVCKRRGGGGAVLLGPHSLCLAIKFPRQNKKSPIDYFAECNGNVIRCLRDSLGLELEPRGISDLAVSDKKVAGTSLYLSRDTGLYLASVLVRIPEKEMDALLKHPSREPDYRGGRSHRDFLTDLASLGYRGTARELSQTFYAYWKSPTE